MKTNTSSPSAEVLLMTATIKAGSTPYVAIRDEKERLLQYLCSLSAWLKLTSINTIIFCENSNTFYDFSKIIEFANNEGKVLELLIFDGNQKAQKKGKGYGEGKIIEFALTNSRNLNQNVNFYKITGRLFVLNFEQIRQMHTDFPNVFKVPCSNKRDNTDGISSFRLTLRFIKRYLISLKAKGGRGLYDPNNAACTTFYKSNVDFFQKNLINSYKRVDDKWNYCLEHAYYDNLF